MRIFDDPALAAAGVDAPFVTVGNFDGFHRGHAAVVAQLLELATKAGATTLAVTFRPHPAAVLSEAGEPPHLASDAQQAELLAAAGLAAWLRQPFDGAFAATPPEEFYESFLRGRLRARGIVVGSSFRFGAHRQGDVAMLDRLARAEHDGPLVAGVGPVTWQGQPVSSSRIRERVTAGSVEEARSLLGRPFAVEGCVVRGDGRGRQLGFPTANVQPIGVIIPGPGVYACALRWRRQVLGAVANVGRRPTFGERPIGVEAHVLDFSGDLYDETVRVAFLHRLRDEQRFAGPAELVARVQADVATARALLADASLEGLAGPGF